MTICYLKQPRPHLPANKINDHGQTHPLDAVRICKRSVHGFNAVFLLACTLFFGLRLIVNIPVYGNGMQAQAIIHSFDMIELLNCASFGVLLADLLFAFRKNGKKHTARRLLILGFNAFLSASCFTRRQFPSRYINPPSLA